METLRKNIKDANERVTKLIAENTTINEQLKMKNQEIELMVRKEADLEKQICENERNEKPINDKDQLIILEDIDSDDEYDEETEKEDENSENEENESESPKDLNEDVCFKFMKGQCKYRLTCTKRLHLKILEYEKTINCKFHEEKS